MLFLEWLVNVRSVLKPCPDLSGEECRRLPPVHNFIFFLTSILFLFRSELQLSSGFVFFFFIFFLGFGGLGTWLGLGF